jgi:hypothetical protein
LKKKRQSKRGASRRMCFSLPCLSPSPSFSLSLSLSLFTLTNSGHSLLITCSRCDAFTMAMATSRGGGGAASAARALLDVGLAAAVVIFSFRFFRSKKVVPATFSLAPSRLGATLRRHCCAREAPARKSLCFFSSLNEAHARELICRGARRKKIDRAAGNGHRTERQRESTHQNDRRLLEQAPPRCRGHLHLDRRADFDPSGEDGLARRAEGGGPKTGWGENETGKTLEKCVHGFPFSVSVRREQALKTLLRPPPLQQQQKKTCRSSSTSGTTRNRSSSAISSASSSWSPSTPSRASSRCCSRSRPLTSTPSATATRCVFFVLLLSFALSSLLSRF